MVLAIALWSIAVDATEPIEFTPPADLHITNVALGADLQDESGRTTLKLVYFGLPAEPESDEDDEDEQEEQGAEPIAAVLCSLTPGTVEQAKLDLVLEANQTYLFDIVGKNTMYISGNYIEQNPSDLPPGEDEVYGEDEEEAFRLEDVSSDVEVEADEVDDDDEAPKLLAPPSPPKAKAQKKDSKKRPREADDIEPAAEQQPSKKQSKKQNKKLKAEGGNAVPAGQVPQEKKPESKKAEQPKVQPEQKKAAEGAQQGEGKKKRRKNKGDKAKL